MVLATQHVLVASGSTDPVFSSRSSEPVRFRISKAPKGRSVEERKGLLGGANLCQCRVMIIAFASPKGGEGKSTDTLEVIFKSDTVREMWLTLIKEAVFKDGYSVTNVPGYLRGSGSI